MKPATVAAVTAVLVLPAASASAQEVFAGGFAHALDIKLGAGKEEHGTDVQVGVRSAPMRRWKAIGRPRLYLYVSKSLNARTNFVAGGMLWRHDFSHRLYGQIGWGLAIHDGAVWASDTHGDPDRTAYGSRVLFESEAGLGLRLGRGWSTELTYAHISNAHIWTDVNPGQDKLGLRLVRRFGAR
ncbi:MAG TPA: acyloxyacyl hydrolase [Caulobacteraceae bacterium]|nr:acyloxyacyl hydrolase [Caulobacteraceae bacterium]